MSNKSINSGQSTPEQFNLSLDEVNEVVYKIPTKENLRSPKGIKNAFDPVMLSMLRKNSYDKLTQYGKDFINSPDSPNFFPSKKSSSTHSGIGDSSPPKPHSNFINTTKNTNINLDTIDSYGLSRSACTSPTTKSSSLAQNESMLSRSEIKKTNSFNEEEKNELFENRSKRAISFSTKTSLAFEFSKSQSLAQMKLNLIRIQTIDDVKVFEKELKKSIKPSKGHPNFEFCKKTQEILFRLCQKIYKSTTNELKKESRNIMNELQTLNIQTEKIEALDEYVRESRKMIRKLIFIFARCARLFEFLRQSSKESPRKEETESSKKESSKKFSIRNILSKVGLGENKSQSELSGSPSKVESPNPLGDAVELVCRICEEKIDSKELEEHSSVCALRQKLEAKSSICDDRFKKLSNSIKKKKKDSLKNLGTYETTLLNILEKFSRNSSVLPYDEETVDDLNLLISDLKDLADGIDRSQLNSTLNLYLKKIEELLNQKLYITQERLKVGGFNSSNPSTKKTRLKITDFDILKPISRGAFGRVFLAKKKKTQDIFAIKVLKKDELYKKKQYDRIMAERNIMAMTANNDFVVKMYYSFQGKEYLYIVMEYLNGGDLFSLLKTVGYFQVDLVRQYSSEILMALEYLHSKKIVHRDLKPDNILIGSDGHIKLTDFGLSEIGLYQNDWLLSDEQNPKMNLDEENDEVFGTPDYLAPELLLGTEHSYEVDLWAFGVILFELLTGCPPFNDETPEDIFDNILSLDIPWPEEGLLPLDAIDLIEGLLCIDPKERYTIDQIKDHPFYRNVNWKNLFTEKSLYVPKLSEDDTSNFDARKELYPVVDDEKLQISKDVIPSTTTSPVGSFNFCGIDNLVEMNKIQIQKLQFE